MTNPKTPRQLGLEKIARDSFLGIETLIKNHREVNRIPSLASSDLLALASDLAVAMQELSYWGFLDDAPLIEEDRHDQP